MVLSQHTEFLYTTGQKRIAYNGSGDPQYIGFNRQGAATSDNDWYLQELSYDGSANLTTVQVAYDSWDNRATATYS